MVIQGRWTIQSTIYCRCNCSSDLYHFRVN